MAQNPIFRGRDTGIVTPGTVQETVNFGLPEAVQAPAGVFDALLKLRLNEQDNARQLFETLAKTNPKLAQYVVDQQPDLLQALIETPRAIPQSKRSLAKQGKTQPTGSLGERVIQAAQGAPQLPEGEPLKPSDKKPFLEFFTPEEATAENVKLALRYASADDPNVAAAAFAALAKAAPKSFTRAGLSPEAKSIVDKAELLLANGLATNRIDALQKILSQPELKQVLLELQIQRSRQVITEAQTALAVGKLDQKNLLDLQDQQAQWQRELADAQKELANFDAQQKGAVAAGPNAGMLGFVPPSPQQLAAAQQRAAEAQRNLDDIKALLMRARMKAAPPGTGTVEAGAETPEERKKRLYELAHPKPKP